jgi:hypothetical protein
MESLLLEIGTEEIPAGYIQPALDALAAGLTQKLLHARVDHGAIFTYGTPRRLAVVIEAVAPRQKALTEQVLGPPERICLDPEGGFTMAAEKFAQKVGVSPNNCNSWIPPRAAISAPSCRTPASARTSSCASCCPRSLSISRFPKPCAGPTERRFCAAHPKRAGTAG